MTSMFPGDEPDLPFRAAWEVEGQKQLFEDEPAAELEAELDEPEDEPEIAELDEGIEDFEPVPVAVYDEDEADEDAPGPDDHLLPPAPRLRAVAAVPGSLPERRVAVRPGVAVAAAGVFALAGTGLIAWAIVESGSGRPTTGKAPVVAPVTSATPQPQAPATKLPAATEAPGPAATKPPAAPAAKPKPAAPATKPKPKPPAAKPHTRPTQQPVPQPTSAAVPAYREPTKGAPVLVSCHRSTSNGQDVYDVKWKIVFTGGVYDVAQSGYGPQREIRHGEAYTWSFVRTYSETAGAPGSTITLPAGNPFLWSDPGSTTVDHSWQPPDYTLNKSDCA